MASENIKDWNLPLPTPENMSEHTDGDLTAVQSQYNENLCRLFYKPANVVSASSYIEYLAKPKKRTLLDNARQFAKVMTPSERGKRLERLARKHANLTVEQLEKIIQSAKAKERKKEDLVKRKENIYYELLTKLELQSRNQYLNMILDKFAHFIAILSTTMPIPSKLFDPYARMQRDLFCIILHSVGVENVNQYTIYNNTSDSSEYAVCCKLSHALLSLITKALDLSSTFSPKVATSHFSYEDAMDNLIKHRLMQAAQKKILKYEKRSQIHNAHTNVN